MWPVQVMGLLMVSVGTGGFCPSHGDTQARVTRFHSSLLLMSPGPCTEAAEVPGPSCVLGESRSPIQVQSREGLGPQGWMWSNLGLCLSPPWASSIELVLWSCF